MTWDAHTHAYMHSHAHACTHVLAQLYTHARAHPHPQTYPTCSTGSAPAPCPPRAAPPSLPLSQAAAPSARRGGACRAAASWPRQPSAPPPPPHLRSTAGSRRGDPHTAMRWWGVPGSGPIASSTPCSSTSPSAVWVQRDSVVYSSPASGTAAPIPASGTAAPTPAPHDRPHTARSTASPQL